MLPYLREFLGPPSHCCPTHPMIETSNLPIAVCSSARTSHLVYAAHPAKSDCTMQIVGVSHLWYLASLQCLQSLSATTLTAFSYPRNAKKVAGGTARLSLLCPSRIHWSLGLLSWVCGGPFGSSSHSSHLGFAVPVERVFPDASAQGSLGDSNVSR